MNNISGKTVSMVQLALFAAIIFILALVPGLGYIPLGFINATTVHIPVIIGSVLMGPKKGAFLGFVFGLTSLINNTVNPNATSFVFSPFYAGSMGEIHGGIKSLAICFVPRILVGVVPFFVYAFVRKLLKNRKGSLAVSLSVAGVFGSLTNTLLVMHLIYLLFAGDYAAARGISVDALYMVILTIIGANGVPEAIVAAVLVVGICRVFFNSRLLQQQAVRAGK